MKRFVFFLSLVWLTLSAAAQLNGDGYYRVQNYATQRYAYLCDNTGSINYDTQNADVGAIQLWKDISRTYDDPASVMYIQNVASGHYDIQAQGTGLNQIIGHYVEVSKRGDNQYWVYASQSGISKYLSDNRINDREDGTPGFNGPTNNRLWSVFPINETDNYVGITPKWHVGGKHYAAFYVSFPFRKVSAGLKFYYIKKVDTALGVAVMEEITSTVIPAATPLIVECPSTSSSGNKIMPVTGGGAAPAGNQLGGVYFCNPSRVSPSVGTPFRVATMRTLGVRADGKIGFISTPDNLTKVEVNYVSQDCLPANSSYLKVPSNTSVELLMFTQAEYEAYSVVKATSITLDKSEAMLKVGESIQLTATVQPTNATDKQVNWTSSNTAVASVTNGKVVALAAGTATITATTADGTKLSATCKIAVTQPATGITLSKTTATLTIGESVQLTATVLPATATNKSVTWKSSNANVATVENGKVVAKAIGTATITATTADGTGLSATCAVTVNPVLATGIALSQTTATLVVGGSLQLTATVLPSNTTNKLVTWKSSDASIATVEDGKVVAKAIGTATITATTADGTGLSATCAVTVNPVLAIGITLSQTQATLTVGETLTLSATVQPGNTTNKQVTWKSSNTAVATVEDGKVVAIGEGTATITVTTADGTNLSATCALTVNPILVTSLTLSQTTATLIVGDELSLTATALPNEAKNKQVTWTSSNEAVATVTDGRVVATGIGTATVTAATVDGSNLTATCAVTVNPFLATSITLNEGQATLKVGDELQLLATVLPEDATNRQVTWASSDTAVAVVEDGRVVATGVGQATITATTVDGSSLSAACQVTVEPILAESIVLSQTAQRLVENASFQLTATVLPENATNRQVNWTSSDEQVAVVEDGKVTAISQGEALITATTADGSNLSATCVITVRPLNVLAESITLSSEAEELRIGEQVQLTATIQPDDVSTSATVWSTSDKNVATVSGNGLVKGIAVGEAVITVTTVDGSNLSATCLVKVNPILVGQIEISQAAAELFLGETLRLTATVAPSNATNKQVEWTTSNPEVATVQNGRVTTVGVGEATITVAATDGSGVSASCLLTVKPILAENLSLNKTIAELILGGELQLTASVQPRNATNKDVAWSSSNTEVATVEDGKVVAVGVGEVVITATTVDGSNLSATCSVKVNPQLATSLAIDPKRLDISLGETYLLTVTVLPANTTNPIVVWSSSNEDVVTVEDGLITAVGIGVASITVATTDGSGLSATCSVIVTPVYAQGLSLTPSEANLNVGDKLQLEAEFEPEGVTNKGLFWISYNERVAKVNQEGLVEAVGEGTVEILATTLDGTGISATALITVVSGNGILTIEAAQPGAEYYTPDGRQRARLQRGVNIVRMADGSVRKIVVR